MLSTHVCLLLVLSSPMVARLAATDEFMVTIDTERPISRVKDKFISLAVGPAVLFNDSTFNMEDPQVIKLAQALYPAYFRVGGTTADSLIFNDNQIQNGPYPNKTLAVSQWDRLNNFAQKCNFSLIFGLNGLYRTGGVWDPDNAIQLLKYSAQKGYKLDWELGNEPDIFPKMFNRSVDPLQLGRDFGRLRDILDSTPFYQSSQLFGPDVTGVLDHSAVLYLENYYMNGQTAKASDFINTTKLNSFREATSMAFQILQNYSRWTGTVWLSETSSAFNGGAPGLSDTFLAGFMWLDKLGISAIYGTEIVFRQDFVGLNYALLDYSNGVYTPNTDYWLTVLFKMLVGDIVLNTYGGDDKLRLYSHCTNPKSGYGAGAVTLYAMNLYNTPKTISFSQFQFKEFHLYILSSGDLSSLTSRSIRLNGKILALSGGELPPLVPVVQNETSVVMEAFTIGFIVVPEADADSCTNTFK